MKEVRDLNARETGEGDRVGSDMREGSQGSLLKPLGPPNFPNLKT